MNKLKSAAISSIVYLLAVASVFAQASVIVDQGALGFAIPTLSDVLTFIIRAFFVLAGLAALLYLLMGAFAWITSGGAKENVEKARDKIQAAIVGVLLIVIVLSIVWTLEQVVFNQKVCFGISCELRFSPLLK